MKTKKRNLLIYTALLSVLALFYGFFLYHGSPACVRPEPGELGMYCLDVGQGDATLFLLPDGKTMLVDTGLETEAPMVIDFLKTMKVTALDVLVCTHWHEDHVGGLSSILQHFPVDAVYAPSMPEDAAMDVRVVSRGDVLFDGDCQVTVLSPAEGGGEEGNDTCLVIKVTYGDTSFMVMGDATSQAERDMLKANQVTKTTVLRVGHHGSSTSSSAAFLRAILPSYAVISVGDNSYNLPSYEAQKRLSDIGCMVFRTDRCGNVAFFSDGTSIRTITDKESETC